MRKVVKNFLDHWLGVKETWRGKKIFLFLDYDGTLTPIVDHPSQAVLAPETLWVLDRLSRNDRCRVAIVSGRSLVDLKAKVGLERIIYVGNHGFELSGPGIQFENKNFLQSRAIFNRIIEELDETLKAMPGVFIEDKNITISIHVRNLEAGEKSLFREILFKKIKPYTQRKDISMREGKEVYELRPPIGWDKGKAVCWLLRGGDPSATVSLYIGDDRTDEDAFKVLKDKSVTICVGPSVSAVAQYYLDHSRDVIALLMEIDATIR